MSSTVSMPRTAFSIAAWRSAGMMRRVSLAYLSRISALVRLRSPVPRGWTTLAARVLPSLKVRRTWVVSGVAHVDVDPLDLADVDLGPQLERGVDRRVQQSHARVRLHGDPFGLPQGAQARVDLFGVGAVALTEDGQPAAVGALEDPLDADVARCRERGGGQPVARGEAVLHALDHRFVHRGHEPARLGRRHPKGVLEPGGVQPVQRSCGRGRGDSAEDHARMPPARQHVQAAERLTDPRAGLVAKDGTEKEALTGDAAHPRGGG